jgi:hypothetical protein
MPGQTEHVQPAPTTAILDETLITTQSTCTARYSLSSEMHPVHLTASSKVDKLRCKEQRTNEAENRCRGDTANYMPGLHHTDLPININL